MPQQAHSKRRKDPRRIDPMRTPLHDYAVVDLETTGFRVEDGARPVEIGAVRVADDQIISEFSMLINPRMPIPAHISDLTGITDDMVAGQPDIPQAMREFEQWLGVSTPLLAHNARFDMSFLDAMARLTWPDAPCFNHPWMDTWEMSRRLHPMRLHHRVSDLILYYGIGDVEEHRGLSDAKQEQKLYEAMRREAFPHQNS